MVAGVSAAAVGAATAVTALMIGMSPGYAASTTSSAYGGSATGAAPFAPTPTVTSTDGSTKTSSAAGLPSNDFISVGALTLSAGNDTASTKLANVDLLSSTSLPSALTDAFKPLSDACNVAEPVLGTVLGAVKQITDQLPDELPITDPDDVCNALDSAGGLASIDSVDVSCKGEGGTMSLGDVTLFGQKIGLPDLDPNTAIIPDNPLLSITANKQSKNDDGSFSITGLVIDIANGQETINLAGATCGKPQAKVAATSTSKPADRDCPSSNGDVKPGTPLTDIYDNPEDVKKDPFRLDANDNGIACDPEWQPDAPKPSPVTTDLPVTG